MYQPILESLLSKALNCLDNYKVIRVKFVYHSVITLRNMLTRFSPETQHPECFTVSIKYKCIAVHRWEV